MENYNYDSFGQCEVSAPDFTLTTLTAKKQLIGTSLRYMKGGWRKGKQRK